MSEGNNDARERTLSLKKMQADLLLPEDTGVQLIPNTPQNFKKTTLPKHFYILKLL